MPTMPRAVVGIGRRSNAPYIGVYFMATSDSRYYIYANNPSWILIPGYCLRICVWMGGSPSPLEKGCKKRGKVPL